MLILAVCLTTMMAQAQQRSVKDSTLRFFTIAPHIGLQQPFADLSDRFGTGGLVGAEVMMKLPSNWSISGQFDYLFSNRVKEDTVLAPLLTDQNFVINREGEPADVFLNQRGFMATASIGKVIPLKFNNPNSGLHIKAGIGFMQHRIYIQETSQKVPQLQGDYIKGYDRLSNGWMLRQSIGYTHFSDHRLINYYVGIDLSQGFTMNRRTVNYDTGLADTQQRIDIAAALVLRWYLPIYKRRTQEFYFY